MPSLKQWELNLGAMEAYSRTVEAHPSVKEGAVDGKPVALEAHFIAEKFYL
jgi:hypothetical protein